MKLKGKLSLLFGETSRIEVKDSISNTTFLRIELDPEQLAQCLGRLANVDCEIDINNTDRLGKKHEHKKYVFPMPSWISSGRLNSCGDKEEVLASECQILLDDEGEGWVSDGHFSSQDSFFTKDDVDYARCIVRRWI